MRPIAIATLIAGLLAASIAAAQSDPQALRALKSGDMAKLNVHSEPRAVSDTTFSDLDGGTHSLADFEGRIVVLNFWATWCAPCREEMPALDAIQADLGGAEFQVVTVASGPNPPPAIRRFFDEAGVDHLPTFIDPRQGLARDMAVLGLPVTVILNRAGDEVARLQGGADWSGKSARSILSRLIESGA